MNLLVSDLPLAALIVAALTTPGAGAQNTPGHPPSTAPAPQGSAASGVTAPAPQGSAATGAAPPEVAATTIRVRGTIKTYDADGGILALNTPGGLLRFPVAAETRVRHAGQTVDRAQLKSLTGLRAAVRYSESGGRTTVESVNVFDTTERNR